MPRLNYHDYHGTATIIPNKAVSTPPYRRAAAASTTAAESACESAADEASDEQKSSARESPVPRISEPASPAVPHKFAHRRILFPLRRRYITSNFIHSFVSLKRAKGVFFFFNAVQIRLWD
ncbi:unnamed protein product [Gongylonema pulchrum]|uniref:Uncharacterized protein n=1 Tax=Gongylonema pulchrum TaxID=637853 RepID=A0A183DD84_9BILA|nr:unnamed protein product [Gongylonema pulchrum]